MSDFSTLTVRLPREAKAKLDKLAGQARRTRSELAGEVLTAFVEREVAIIEAIERGRAEIRAGQGFDPDEVFRDVEGVIAQVEAERAGR
ncbi:MAG: ribbon-helix-helix protein, CopG family [Methylorubrum populi]